MPVATSAGTALAEWAAGLVPTAAESLLARRSLVDTVAVTLAARDHEVGRLVTDAGEAARWATVGHVLDFDDLHLDSTTHVSVVCVAAALAAGGDERAYLAGAGVMARIGTALGWRHYAAGWHSTCTAGAPGAAVAAAVALGLDAERTAAAMALSMPAAGGVQRAFGTDAKSLQVGFAAEAGVRAARLAAAGATADPFALDAWLDLMGVDPASVTASVADRGAAIPGGLAVKVYPCCYGLQRPLAAVATARELLGDRATREVTRIVARMPRSSAQPLIHHRPTTGLAAKFSLEYAMAAGLLDDYPGFASFADEAVVRPEAQRLLRLVEVEYPTEGEGILAGTFEVAVHADGQVVETSLGIPPGHPSAASATDPLGDIAGKVADCAAGTGIDAAVLTGLSWEGARDLLREWC